MNTSKHKLVYLLIIFVLLNPSPILAQSSPTSPNYVMKQWGFGSGGGSQSDGTISIFSVSGEDSIGNETSPNYQLQAGLNYTINKNVPAAPTVTNPSNYYNKLHLVIDSANNPNTTTYAIAISTDNFVSDKRFIKNDHTITSSLSTSDWQTYTDWGGASGFNVLGLSPNTTYYFRSSAFQGDYSQSPFGPAASGATQNSQLSFNITPNIINLGSLTPNSVIVSGTTITTTSSTNGSGGVFVYVTGTNGGLKSTATNYTINTTSSNLVSQTEGFGIRGTSTSQTSGGPMNILSPYNGTGNVVGAVSSSKQAIFDSSNQPVTNGQAIFEIQAKSSDVTPAANDYSESITVIASSSF